MLRLPTWTFLRVLGASCGALLLACSANNGGGGAGGDASSSSATAGDGGGGASPSSTSSAGGADVIDPSSGGGTPTCTVSDPSIDNDGDGYSQDDGDCNDCDPNTNPGAIEVPTPEGGTPADENCDGDIDEEPAACDDGLAIDTSDPTDAAKAIGLCDTSRILSAKWVLADGNEPPADPTLLANFHLGHGIIDAIGPNVTPQQGTRMLALSSGSVRDPLAPTGTSFQRNFDKGYTSGAPTGFPKESSSCPGVTTGQAHDATGLELEITAPTNALSFSFDFNFFTYEWPQFICTEFNDFFVAYMDPKPAGLPDGNISFDNAGNPISVNNAFLDICGCPGGGACEAGLNSDVKKSFACALGSTGVLGTPWAVNSSTGNPPPPAGWTNGSSGWLRTSAPVAKGQTFKVRLVTYDSDDGNVDSTTLIDNWHWSAEAGTTQTVVIPPK